MINISKINRREFIKFSGFSVAGLTLQVALSESANGTNVGLLKQPSKKSKSTKFSLNIFVHIGENDRITIMAHRSEMGQGIRTSLPQIVADEMEADWTKIDIVQADGELIYGNQNTDGSRSVRHFYQPMREMGASAKYMLCQAAALTWKVELVDCVASNHRVFHKPSGKSLSYGELALSAAQIPLPDPKSLTFKSAEDYQYIGKSIGMVDAVQMTCGKADYGIDIELPNLLYASIERCPVLGGKLVSLDDKQVFNVTGVKQVVKIDGGFEPAGFRPLSGVAVIATNTWAAMQGRKLLKINWGQSAHNSYDSRDDIKKASLKLTGKGKVVSRKGNVGTIFSNATRTFSAVYAIPHLEHATLEPPCATARIKGDFCEVWACVQDPISAKNIIANALALKPENVTVHVTLLGGGFGRKAKPDFAVEAALLAKATGKPVKVTWSREDATRHGYYHPYGVYHFRAGFNQSSKPIAIDLGLASPSIVSLFKPGVEYLQGFALEGGITNLPYSIENVLAKNYPVKAHTRIGWLRSVHNINHAFAINSFFDELATFNKSDSLEYLMRLLASDAIVSGEISNESGVFNSSRLQKVLLSIKQSTAWPAAVAAMEGWGVAAHFSFGSYVAVATRVIIIENKLRVEEVHIAIDCGQVVNPDRVHAQMEGSVIFGLSAALFGEISFKNGVVEQSSFDDYPLLRMNQTPKIKVTVMDSREAHGGVGEPGVPPVAPSIVNAIAAAHGQRIRDLPISKYMQIL